MAESTIASKVPWTKPATNSGNAISSLNAPARAAMVSVACLRGPLGGGVSSVGAAAGALFGGPAGGADPRSPPRKSDGVPRLVADERLSLVRRTSGGGGGRFISRRCRRGPVAPLIDRAVAVQE